MIDDDKKGVFVKILVVVLVLWVLSFVLAAFASFFVPSQFLVGGNVALVKVEGEIVTGGSDGFLGASGASSSDIVKLLKEADENPGVSAILLEINSPGGSPVGSYEIAQAVRKLNKTCVAYIREVGASGGYWVASASDYVVANPLAITGSIGVYSSYLEFSGLMSKYGVSYQRVVSGDFKDLGSPFRNLSESDKEVLLSKISIIHEFFVSKVAEFRGLNKSDVDKLATGLFYIGSEAKDLGLVDAVGDEDFVKEYIRDKLELESVELVEYETKRSFFDSFSGVVARNFFFLGKGFGSAFVGQNFVVRT
jgi:protease-4